MFSQDGTMLPPHWFLPGYSDMTGFIVDCESCDLAVMQYDRCENIMACM